MENKYFQYYKKWPGLFFLFLSLCYTTLSCGSLHYQPDLLSYVDSSGTLQPVRTRAEWRIKRRQILDRMELVMGALPSREDLPPMNIQYIDSVEGDGYVRYTINFTVTKGEQLPAYLYIPASANKDNKRPAMLALHPTGMLGKKIVDGQGSLPNRAYAKELAGRGYVVITPDYPGYGGLKNYNFKTDRYLSGTMKSIFNNMRCVDLLQARDDVDGDRIGVIGHSLGGHSAMFVGAFDTRLKVIVSSCGWTLMHYYFNGDTTAMKKKGGKLWPWAQEQYMPLFRTKYDLDPDKVPFDFDEVIAALAPRAFFSNSPLYDSNFNVDGVERGIERASRVYQFLGAENNSTVYYPPSEHDFPSKVRSKAYQFIDSVFNVKHVGKKHSLYLDNPKYLKQIRLFAKDDDQENIVMLGNSLTERGDWVELLGRSDVANRGIGSDITAGYLNRINYVFNVNPKICFIEGGVNDLAHHIPRNIIINNLSTLIDTLRYENIIPVLNTVTLVADNYRYIAPDKFNHQIKMLNTAIKDLADRKEALLINLNPIITNGNFLLKRYAVNDGIHYTESAYLVWEAEIIKVLSKLNLDR